MIRPATRTLLLIAIILAVTAGLVVYGTFDPATYPFPQCVFRRLTGYECPGCGSQRALHALLKGDISRAVGYNLLLAAALPFMALLAYATVAKQRHPRLYASLTGSTACYLTFAIVVGWTIIRNIFSI